MLETITVFGYVGEDVVEIDLEDIVNDWGFAIELAKVEGSKVVFQPDGHRRVRT